MMKITVLAALASYVAAFQLAGVRPMTTRTMDVKMSKGNWAEERGIPISFEEYMRQKAGGAAPVAAAPAPAAPAPAAYVPPPAAPAPAASHGGKGFGGGEATRDPAPTFVDPNDPKGKQQAIHKAESFADYLARRNGGAAAAPAPAAPAPAAPVGYVAPTAPAAYVPPPAAPAPVAAHGGKGFGGGEATRDPEPTFVDPNDPKGKQQAIHKAESFADYLARRNGA